MKEGDTIGRILVIEFNDGDTPVFDEIIRALKRHHSFERLHLNSESVLSLPGLKIYPDRRKVYHDKEEIYLTTKEFDILCMLAVNKGQVVTYEQIYQNVWNEIPTSREHETVGFHVRNLRKKLGMIPFFSIKCTREVGYCFSMESENSQQSG